jgi:hypothetical protein
MGESHRTRRPVSPHASGRYTRIAIIAGCLNLAALGLTGCGSTGGSATSDVYEAPIVMELAPEAFASLFGADSAKIDMPSLADVQAAEEKAAELGDARAVTQGLECERQLFNCQIRPKTPM